MQKSSGIFLSLISSTIAYSYYGPPPAFVPDRLYVSMMQESIDSTKSLERTIAMRPHLSMNNYNHQDHSTHMRFAGANKAPIYISHGVPSSVVQKPETPAVASADNAGWRSWLPWGASDPAQQKNDGLLGSKRDLTYKALVLGYAYLNFRLFRASAYLQESERWFLWKQELPLADLIALPQTEVAHWLVADIRQRYGTLHKDGNDENPFGRFMKALEDEEAVVRTYQTLSNILLKVDDLEHRCLQACCNYMPKVYGISLSYFITCLAAKVRVKTLFYLDDALLQLVPDRLARLAYLKSVFTDWLASHKLFTAQRTLYKEVMGLRYKKAQSVQLGS